MTRTTQRRQPSRSAVDRALRECAILWKPPDKKETADPERNSESTAEQSTDTENHTPARPRKVAP